MKNIVGLAFSVGDSTLRFTIGIEQDNLNWWHIFSVARYKVDKANLVSLLNRTPISGS